MQQESCPKCGGHFGSPEYQPFYYNCGYLVPVETLLFRCTNCGYMHRKPTLDAKKTEKKS